VKKISWSTSLPPVRRRYTAEERLEFVRCYLESGLTQKEFVARHGFSLAALSKWLRQARLSSPQTLKPRRRRRWRKPGTALQEVSLSSVLAPMAWAAELRGPSGTVLSIGADVSPQLLRLLLRRL
jgi:transposase-like protein